MLVNRCYLGFVKFEHIWYEGRHPALIDQELFDRVQTVRIARALTREKTQKHPHYLKGSIYCGQCGAWMGISNITNRWGTVYPYFYCLGRAKKKNCAQSAVLIADVEASVADYWTRVQLTEEQITEIREHVTHSLTRQQARNQGELDRQHRRVRELENQRLKLLEARYADAIPLELFKSEQERITRELAGAAQIIERCSTEINAVMRVVDEALLIAANAHRLYLSAPPDVRRQLNQAVFARFWIIDDQVQGADLTDTFAQLLDPDLAARLQDENEAAANTRATGAHVDQPDGIQRPNGPLPTEMTNPGPNRDRGSNIRTQVELRGFEPLTPSMRTRCATGLRHSPENLSQPSKRSTLPAHRRSPPPPAPDDSGA